MGLSKVANTKHSKVRALERTNLDHKGRTKLIKNACRHGKTWEMLKQGSLRNYVFDKQSRSRKKIKYYNGYLFVFQKTSTACITLYPVPKEIMVHPYDENTVEKKEPKYEVIFHKRFDKLVHEQAIGNSSDVITYYKKVKDERMLKSCLSKEGALAYKAELRKTMKNGYYSSGLNSKYDYSNGDRVTIRRMK